MKTFTVPVFIGVVADSPAEAVEKTLTFMEYAMDIGNDSDEFPYCSVGLEHEVVEQLEVKS